MFNYKIEDVIDDLQHQREVLEAQLETIKSVIAKLERIDENNN